MKTPDFMSYDRYKKKKKNKDKDGLIIGITTFFITLLLFTAIAKSLSPDVDVTIGDESETDAKETGLGVKRFIDERLRMIQMEDNSAGVSMPGENKKTSKFNDESFNSYSRKLDEESMESATANSAEDEITEEPMNPFSERPAVKAPPRPSSKDLSVTLDTPKVTKVYVGRYSNLEQAKVAQGILVDSGLNVTPFIKDLGGTYTLQIGSFSTRAKAEGIASELRANNFPARVIQE